METIYKIGKGIVLGNCWGGGRVFYPSDYVGKEFKSLIDLKEFITKTFKSGALDSGMGFESLIGYLIDLETIRKIRKNNMVFSNVENDFIIYGLDDIDDDVYDIFVKVHG